MHPQMLLQRYENGKRDFSWSDLQGVDLSHQNLSEINLYRANLAGANLQGTNLSKANLFKASLVQANLNGADLTAANLCKVDLLGAVMEDVCLEETKLRGAKLPDGSVYESPLLDAEGEDAEFEDAKYENAKYKDELMPAENAPEALLLEEVPVVGEAEAELLRSQIEACELAAVAQLEKIPVFDTNDPLWCRGMTGVIAGFLCFGASLQVSAVPFPVWLVVWASIFIAEGKPESVWVVPVTAAAIATLFADLSLINIVLTGLLIVLNIGGLFFYGSILGQRFKKTVQDGLFLCALCFVVLNLRLLTVLGVVTAVFGFLFLLRDSKELGKIVPNKKREAAPWVRRRRRIEQKRFYQQFGVAALIGLVAGGFVSLPFMG